MILAHLIVGLMPIKNSKFSWFWLIGSIIPDLDHVFVLVKHKIFSWRRILDAMRFEDKYHLHFKTKYLHSVFGAGILTIPILFLGLSTAVYFFVAYIIHLLLDWPDQDEKQYLYPLKIKSRGFLPIFSREEIIFTILLLSLYTYSVFK